ncbi:MAG: DUF3995 domain-containing protein [Acidobacteria bacterium]|nr:DUF3995 domain-containing protein [Acidobacteriota bacterium]
MSVWGWLAAVAALVTFLVHTFLGHRYVFLPFLDSNTEPFAKATLTVGWHFITFWLAFQAVSFFALPSLDPAVQPYVFGTFLLPDLAFFGLFASISRLKFGSFTKMPQTGLFLTILLPLGLTLTSPLPRPTGELFLGTAIGIFLAIAWLHWLWAKGSTWPARSREKLTQLVVGTQVGKGFPSRSATLFVAITLLGFAVWLILRLRYPLLIKEPWDLFGLALIFALRGFGGFFEFWIRPSTQTVAYGHYNRVLYSPLCIALASLIWGGAQWLV